MQTVVVTGLGVSVHRQVLHVQSHVASRLQQLPRLAVRHRRTLGPQSMNTGVQNNG